MSPPNEDPGSRGDDGTGGPEDAGFGSPAGSSESERDGRRILLVDCDQFYVQVARLEDPEGAGEEELLLVGGSASGRGVVTSASYEARRYGVSSAMPTARALELCPDAVVVPVPRRACARRSREVRHALERLSPVVEAASIDEFYLDLTGTERLFGEESLEETARRIRRTVLDESGISVSVGGGTTKMVAKLAAGLAKPAGVHVVSAGSEGAFMKRFELGELPGVGPALLEKLEARGLRTVEDVLPVDEEWLVRWFGESRGRWLHRRARGVDPTPVRASAPRKSVSSERTFRRDLTDPDALRTELMKQVVSATSSLRKHGLRARTVTVKLRDADFTTRQASHTLADGVESESAVFAVARTLLEDLRQRRRAGVRLLGVGLSSLEDRESPAQLGLFGGEARLETERDRTLARVMDGLRDRFGDEAVLPGRIVEEPEDGRE